MKKRVLILLVMTVLILSGCAKSNPQDLISEEKAIGIALDKAGVSENEIIREKFKLDFDDGIYKYDFEFRKGKTEYDAEIKADDGTIISWEMDMYD